MKRATPDTPCDDNNLVTSKRKRKHKIPKTYIYFVCWREEGNFVYRMDTNSTVRIKEIEALFGKLVRGKYRWNARMDTEEYTTQRLFDTIMDYIHTLKQGYDPKNERELLEKCCGTKFPFDWTIEDWGVWECQDGITWEETEGKHYFFWQ
jgi:hypothetical protein